MNTRFVLTFLALAGLSCGLAACSPAESAVAGIGGCELHTVPSFDGGLALVQREEGCLEEGTPVVEVAERY